MSHALFRHTRIRHLGCVLTLWLSTLVRADGGIVVEQLERTLNKPWSVAELPDGELLITEKPGRLLRRTNRGELVTISGVPEVFYAAQGGLFEVMLHPDFNNNRWLYLSYASGDAASNATRVIRGKLSGNTLQQVEELLTVTPAKAGSYHFGGKLAFMHDGTLLITVGEGYDYRDQAQVLGSELGKVLRIHDDGTIPPGNPFPKAAPRVYSYGHRNPQGIIILPDSSEVYLMEHGPKGGDELNLLQAGVNYGWPEITYGREYSGELITPYTEAEGMAQPLTYWVPSIAPSGLALVQGDMFPDMAGDLLAGALRDRKLYRIALDQGRVVGQSEPFPEITGRVRDVRMAADGAILVVTDEGTLYRISRRHRGKADLSAK